MRTLLLLALALLLALPAAAQPVTGLDGWTIILDPGHSQDENMGVYGYSEARKNLEVSLALEQLLDAQTDIDSVYLTRDNHQVQISLSQRVDYANNVGADHFHSVHSNAAAPSANNIFVLWPQYRSGEEAVPNGGKRMAELMADRLGEAMRIPSLGGIGECDFYGVSSCRTRNLGVGKGGSRNFVQSFTAMPSELSEAGFHTNPRQNQLNMNADWKRMEALAFFWAILDYHGLEAPPVHIATGTVRNVESGRPLNGAVVHIADTSYTTDTYESLFHRYSDDPEQLSNGFYYLDRLPPGTHEVVVEAPGYITHESEVTLREDGFTFHDVALVSTRPPVVAATEPEPGAAHNVLEPLVLHFSRPMDPATVEAAWTIDPAVEGSFTWADGDRRLVFHPDTLLPFTDFTLTIGPSAASPYGYTLDGDGDGTGSGTAEDAFILPFRTGAPDGTPPALVAGYPAPRARGVPRHPVLTYEFDERLDVTSITAERFTLRRNQSDADVSGTLEHYTRNERTAVSFFPDAPLDPGVYYTFTVEPGVRDRHGNARESEYAILFQTTEAEIETRTIDDFDGGLDDWWAPQSSGSTTGIVTDSTGRAPVAAPVNHLTGSTTAMRLDYGWDANASTQLLREYYAPGGASFDDSWQLQVYLLGDGSGNRFRFALDDQGSTEVSPWVDIDWIGWRLVAWDLSEGATGRWIGDGTLDPPFSFDSFQMTGTAGQPLFGHVVLDDLRLARAVTGNDARGEDALPAHVMLQTPYPNPFREAVTLAFALPAPAPVTLHVYDALGRRVATLADERPFAAGHHTLRWAAEALPAGVYVARLHAADATASTPLVRVR